MNFYRDVLHINFSDNFNVVNPFDIRQINMLDEFNAHLISGVIPNSFIENFDTFNFII